MAFTPQQEAMILETITAMREQLLLDVLPAHLKRDGGRVICTECGAPFLIDADTDNRGEPLGNGVLAIREAHNAGCSHETARRNRRIVIRG